MAKAPEAGEAQKKKDIWRGVRGPVVPGSLVETDRFAEARVQVSPNGFKVVRAYNNKPELVNQLKAAAESGKPTLFEGKILGSNANNSVHVAVNSIDNPQKVVGKVYRANHSDPSKQPWVGGWMLREIQKSDGTSFKQGREFRAFGDAATALAGLKAGDTFSADGYQTSFKNEKDGNTTFVEGIEIIGNVTIGEPEIKTNPEEDKKAEAAMASDPFPANTGDFDDEIPF